MRCIRFAFLTGIILILSSTLPLNLVNAISPVYSTDSSPYGIPYQKWIERNWQWKYNIPTAQNPLNNYSPEKCAIGQHGPVWHLTELLSGTEKRTCTIPAGKSIFLPVLNGECDRSDTKTHNDQDLIHCASAGNEYGVIQRVSMACQLNWIHTEHGLTSLI